MNLNLPTLYKTTSKGATQQWTISVMRQRDGTGIIRTVHGQKDGKLQVAEVHIIRGKNAGKTNATSAMQQATSEARAKWVKQLDKGYTEKVGGTDVSLKPMLAHKYQDHIDKCVFPCFIQPKLDGVRAIAVRDGDSIKLISRLGKEHVGLKHIREALLRLMKDDEIWDGELYTHGMTFQTLVSFVKKDRPESAQVQYHVYDKVDDKIFATRNWELVDSFGLTEKGPVCMVQTIGVKNHEDVQRHYAEFVEDGYEGAMLRSGECPYKRGYRSHDLLKIKTFLDDEFEIVDVVNGVGKEVNKATFVCVTKDGSQFRARPKGRDALRERYLEDRKKLIGKMLTVSFFEWTTSEPKLPRFPTGIVVRDYE